MNIFTVLAAVGMIALAGACGVLLGIIDKYLEEREK